LNQPAVFGAYVIKLQQAFEPFNTQLNLPTHAIKNEDELA
jgi:hypothetical protein